MLFHSAQGAGGFSVGGGGGGGITLVGATNLAGPNTETFSIDLTAIGTLQEGDLVIVTGVLTQANTELYASMTSSGYTNIANLFVNDSYDITQAIFYKVMGSTPDTSADVLFPTTRDDWTILIDVRVYRGVDATTPFDVTSTTAEQNNTAIPNPPAITPITSGSVIVVVGSGVHTRGDIPFTSSELSNFQSTSYNNSNREGSIGSGDISWVSGSVDPAAFSWAGGDSTLYAATAITMALKPA